VRWLKRTEAGKRLRIFYASDVHGSDVCWRKFVNAARHYECEALIMGGDLTGKALVPIVHRNGGYTAWLGGEERHARSAEEVDELERAVRMNGFYPLQATEDELRALRDSEDVREQAFARAMTEALEKWLAFADERLGGSDVGVFVMAGNDDPWSVDPVLEQSAAVTACDGRVVRIGDREMISCGYSNRTPWNSPRELDEDELYSRIRALAEQLEAPDTAIFNLHVPPYDSGLDTAIELDDELRPVLHGGRPREIPVGSRAVRQLLEEFEPALALHGHIHESRGIARIGRTVAINPGSTYNAGRIDGCVIDLTATGVRSYRLVSG